MILAPGKAARAEICGQLTLPDAQQRPIQPSRQARHAACTIHARAAQQVHQHGFGLVVQVMRQRDVVRATVLPRSLQKGVPRLPRSGLEPLAALPGEGRHVDSL